MAHELAEGAISEGYDVEIFYLHEDERSEIVKSILTSKGIAIGDPTINDEPYPSIGDIMYYLKGLRFDKKQILTEKQLHSVPWVEKEELLKTR